MRGFRAYERPHPHPTPRADHEIECLSTPGSSLIYSEEDAVRGGGDLLLGDWLEMTLIDPCGFLIWMEMLDSSLTGLHTEGNVCACVLLKPRRPRHDVCLLTTVRVNTYFVFATGYLHLWS